MPLASSKKIRLKIFAEEIRMATMRAIASYGEGHVGGALSIADVLAVLYGNVLRVNPKEPGDPNRDKFVLSKGHCGPALYAVLALRGFFPMDTLDTLNRFGTILPSHCDRLRTPGVDMSTGSLGQGASAAAGIALADKLLHRDSLTCLLLGDGECDEGQVWEMAMFAAQQKLDHLLVFVDRNRQQLDGYTKDICAIGDLAEVFGSFGWKAQTVNGNDVEAIAGAIERTRTNLGAPSVIVLDTVKGSGWAEAERKVPCHYMTVSKEQLSQYEAEFRQRVSALHIQMESDTERAGEGA